ncbi:unnamed protein product [Periconia digitata]|uniref:Uncharacterized protein n=1 Tax=Periconia digitata TaxID=1303443 RepID=A0A9W4UX79_9PLEO|nr:unnamed protein product [Periconia digitata]
MMMYHPISRREKIRYIEPSAHSPPVIPATTPDLRDTVIGKVFEPEVSCSMMLYNWLTALA